MICYWEKKTENKIGGRWSPTVDEHHGKIPQRGKEEIDDGKKTIEKKPLKERRHFKVYKFTTFSYFSKSATFSYFSKSTTFPFTFYFLHIPYTFIALPIYHTCIVNLEIIWQHGSTYIMYATLKRVINHWPIYRCTSRPVGQVQSLNKICWFGQLHIRFVKLINFMRTEDTSEPYQVHIILNEN